MTVTMIVDPSVSSLFSSNPNAIRSMMILIGSNLMNENDDGVVHNLQCTETELPPNPTHPQLREVIFCIVNF